MTDRTKEKTARLAAMYGTGRRVEMPGVMGMPYTGETAWPTRPKVVYMVAADLVPENHPAFPMLSAMQMRDEHRRAYEWMAVHAQLYFAMTEPPAFIKDSLGVIFPERYRKD